MKNIYLLTVLLCTKIIFAQTYIPFPNDSAEWYNKVTCQVSNCNTISQKAPDQITQKGDTVINFKTYHKLYNASNNSLHSFYREFSKRIYSKYPLGGIFASDTAEFVLYDFNLNIGDTFYVKVPSSWTVVYPQSLKRVVASISNTVLTSGSHKTFNFPATTYTAGCSMNPMTWIEGVGASSGILYNLNYYYWSICMSYPGPYNVKLTCNLRNGGLYYVNGCTITDINNSNIKNNEISICPNPTNGNFTLKLNTTDETKKQIELTNLLGEIIFKQEINNNESQININNFDNGIYFLQIFDKNKLIGTTKIIKQ